ncbi:MAG: hypothetical protein LC725_04680 [Lentisphaerae bacterium]|nr:hypothetical protein [Lentisphaerota bacterium]
MSKHDHDILRELARQYMAVCQSPLQTQHRHLWRQHNSLKPTRPLIYVRAFAWQEMPQAQCLCQDAFYRAHENTLRQRLFWHSLNDDSIFEPWLTLPAQYKCTGWGLSGERITSGDPGGSWKTDYPIKKLDDIEKMRIARHEIDEEATAANLRKLEDALGGILPVNLDRGPVYRMWAADISTSLGHLRGIENIMLDMLDNPEWLHRLLGFMRDGILKTQAEAEAAGDWGLAHHQNQAMPYAEELTDPAANVNGIKRKQLWVFMAAQEFTSVSPAMHDEFMLQYQLPIMREFGLAAYGCCEDLTNKIDMLRQITNLRRIAVSPFANVPRCAEQIGQDYVLSYRPSPADMVSYGFNADRVRTILKRDLQACRNCHVDITLKDVQTVENDPERVRQWVQLTREVIDTVGG